MYPNPQDVTRVTSIGGGPIGGGWAAHFLARGYDVTSYLHSEAETGAFRDIVDTAGSASPPWALRRAHHWIACVS